MKSRLICKGCHRIRVIASAGYCGACNDALRAAERPKRSSPHDPAIVDVPRGVDLDDLVTASPKPEQASGDLAPGIPPERERVTVPEGFEKPADDPCKPDIFAETYEPVEPPLEVLRCTCGANAACAGLYGPPEHRPDCALNLRRAFGGVWPTPVCLVCRRAPPEVELVEVEAFGPVRLAYCLEHAPKPAEEKPTC